MFPVLQPVGLEIPVTDASATITATPVTTSTTSTTSPTTIDSNETNTEIHNNSAVTEVTELETSSDAVHTNTPPEGKTDGSSPQVLVNQPIGIPREHSDSANGSSSNTNNDFAMNDGGD